MIVGLSRLGDDSGASWNLVSPSGQVNCVPNTPTYAACLASVGATAANPTVTQSVWVASPIPTTQTQAQTQSQTTPVTETPTTTTTGSTTTTDSASASTSDSSLFGLSTETLLLLGGGLALLLFFGGRG